MAKGRHARLISVLAALTLFLLASAGCKQQALSNRNLREKPTNKNPSDARSDLGAGQTTNPGTDGGQNATDTMEVTLYFSDAQAEKLIKETRSVPRTKTVAKAAVEELIDGPSRGGVATIPKGTRLIGITVVDGLAEVNLSKELVDNHTGGSAGERLTVYSIVDTLTEFSSITDVRLLVEGRSVDTIAGHMDLSEPLKRDDSLL